MSTTLGNKIRNHRKSLQQTQADASHALRVTQQTVASWEAGQRPAPAQFDAIAHYLGCTKEDIIGMIYLAQPETDVAEAITEFRDEVSVLTGQVSVLTAALQTLVERLDK